MKMKILFEKELKVMLSDDSIVIKKAIFNHGTFTPDGTYWQDTFCVFYEDAEKMSEEKTIGNNSFPPNYWLKLGLVSGEHLLCSHCGKTIEGANDPEHGLAYFLVIPPLSEVAQILCETCFETGKNENQRSLGNVER